MSTATSIDEQDALEFEGESVVNRKLSVKGEVPLDEVPKLHRHQKFAIVGMAKVEGVAFKDVSGVATRVHDAKLDDAVLVPTSLVEDLIDEDRERRTGEMRLLSLEGEHRRAARRALWERDRQADELGYGAEHLDEKDPIDGGIDFIRVVEESQFVKLRMLTATFDDLNDPLAWYTLAETEFTQAAAVMLAGIEWARRQSAAAAEQIRLMEEEQRRLDRERAQQAAAVHDDPDDTPAAQMRDDVTTDTTTGAVLPPDAAPVVRMATEAQVGWIRSNLLGLTEGMIKKYSAWIDEQGSPHPPQEMTFVQAAAALRHLGDADHAEAE